MYSFYKGVQWLKHLSYLLGEVKILPSKSKVLRRIGPYHGWKRNKDCMIFPFLLHGNSQKLQIKE